MLVAGIVVGVVVGVVGWDFFAATTFIGDDHLFLTFARFAASPLVPFVTDQHGGEYYRPVPMALWWLLARAGGGAEWPFAVAGLALHAAAAMLTGALVRATGRPAATAVLAAVLFFVAPAEREAALWFSASTDLLATVATLGAIVCLLRDRRAPSLILAAVAYLSKESALVLPLLAGAAVWFSGRERRSIRPVLPHLALAGAAVVARLAVLGRMGGAGDPAAALAARALQMASGLVHALIGSGPLPEAVAWPLGAGVLLWGAWRSRRATPLPLLFAGLALLPLLAAGWLVGTRYFYLPAVGVAWLAAEGLARGDRVTTMAAPVCLLALGTVAALGRRDDIANYRARLSVAVEAAQAELAQNHVLVHVRCGIKDLDLAVKNRLRGRADQLLLLSDVPASFVLVPPALAERTAFLRAMPPLPPSGAYRFGGQAVVGLVRREESPSLEEILQRLPELRFVALVDSGRGIGWRDVTGAP
jgi:hypothetical protein